MLRTAQCQTSTRAFGRWEGPIATGDWATRTLPGKTAKQFYDTLGSGGVEKPLPGGKGWRSRFDDGSSVVYRPWSKSGSPAVEITVNTAKGDRYKIHFEH